MLSISFPRTHNLTFNLSYSCMTFCRNLALSSSKLSLARRGRKKYLRKLNIALKMLIITAPFHCHFQFTLWSPRKWEIISTLGHGNWALKISLLQIENGTATDTRIYCENAAHIFGKVKIISILARKNLGLSALINLHFAVHVHAIHRIERATDCCIKMFAFLWVIFFHFFPPKLLHIHSHRHPYFMLPWITVSQCSTSGLLSCISVTECYETELKKKGIWSSYLLNSAWRLTFILLVVFAEIVQNTTYFEHKLI